MPARTYEMSEKEIKRSQIIKMAEERHITQKQAAERLGVTERHIRRLIKQYREKGEEGLISKKRGQKGNRQLPEEKRKKILGKLYSCYQGMGPTLVSEKLAERDQVKVSKETIRKIMIAEGLHKPKRKKKVRLYQIRERKARRGELVQIDGSYHAWLGERAEKACLILFVDDATGEILAGEFVKHESFFAYARVCKRYFRQTGLPKAFYSDKHGIFRVNAKQSLNTTALSQFGRAMQQLGIEIICANTPQAKGRVERMNKTLQDRLVHELRLENINDYDTANRFLPQYFVNLNQRFAVAPRSNVDAHVPLLSDNNIDFILSWQESRLLSKDMQMQFRNTIYQIQSSRPAYVLKNRKVTVCVDELDQVSILLNGSKLKYETVFRHPRQSSVKDVKTLAANSPAIPASNHPWRNYGNKLNGKPV